MATFLIIVREAFEAALLLGILYAYLRQLGANAQAHFVTWGPRWAWWPVWGWGLP